jgi:hypothetical protein
VDDLEQAERDLLEARFSAATSLRVPTFSETIS